MFTKPMPERFDMLKWQCPAFIIDYVRIFERVPMDAVTANHLEHCPNIALNDSKPILKKVCAMAMASMEVVRNEDHDDG